MGISFNTAALLSGNGIDVSSVVSQVQAASNGQLTIWQGDVTSLKTQATAIGTINTDLTSLQTAVQALASPTGVLTQLSAGSSEPTVVSATAQSGATPAIYNIAVTTLASAGTLYTDALANATTSILPANATTGDLQVQVGGSTGITADIPITSGTGGNNTLTTLANSINTLSATNKWGITASVLTDASGSRLAIYSQSTGSSGALSIPANTNTTSLNFEPPVGGTNAVFSLNGIPYSSSTNTVTGAIADVTLNLISTDPSPVEILVSTNTANITTAINNFVTAYNTVIGDINTQFTVDPSTNQEGPLGGDTYLRSLQSSLLSDLGYQTTDATSVSSGLTNLAAVGIVMNNDGTLTVNQTAVDTDTQYSPALPDVLSSNPSALLNFFQNSSSTGFANNLNTDLTNLTGPSTGVLNEDLTANQDQQSDLSTEITNFQTQAAAQKVQLTQQFDNVNSSLEQYPLLLQEVTAILESLTVGASTTGTTTSTNTTPTSGNSPTTGTSGTSGTSS
jgi:flagellar hook-associated protein 2